MMRLAQTFALWTLYAFQNGEADGQCGPHQAVDSEVLLQVGSLMKEDPSRLPTHNRSLPTHNRSLPTNNRSEEVLATIVDEASAPRGEHSYGIFHYRIWSHPHWKKKRLPENWKLPNVLNSAKGFDWICLVLSFNFAFILRWVFLWQDDDKQLKPHLTSMGVWFFLACILCTAIWRRFGEAEGMQWAAGYVFELFFMLENVFVFQYVIQFTGLPRRLVARVLDRVVWAQIIFEAVFFLGLANQLRSVHLLPQFLGFGLTILGVSTLIETIKKTDGEADGCFGSAIKTVTSSESLVSGAANEDGLFSLEDDRLRLTVAGLVWLLLLVIDFLCEIDTVLTKIEEIRNPFIAFSSSAIAAFSLPELFLLSQDLLFYFPLVKCGIGMILCLLGVQMICAKLVVIQPAVTCCVMVGIISVFILLSALIDEKQTGVEIKQASIEEES